MQLYDWIKLNNVPISHVSETICVGRAMVYRYFAGVIPRKKIIQRVEIMTRGAVTAQDFYINAVAKNQLLNNAVAPASEIDTSATDDRVVAPWTTTTAKGLFAALCVEELILTLLPVA